MVNFSNDTTVTVPPGEVVKILVLERREQVIEALEAYYFVDEHTDSQHKVSALRARIMALWFQVEAIARRRLEDAKGTDEEPTYDMVEEAVTSAKKVDELVGVFKFLNKFVDEMGLTQVDNRAKYDRTRIEEANSKKGLG